jgi:mono/diheme cytochrome c family protein
LSADHSFKRLNAAAIGCGVLVLCFWLGSCQQQMAKQPRFKPLEKSEFFDDQRASRPLVEGTVARGLLGDDELLYHGLVDGKPADRFPFTVDNAVLKRGQERFNIFCAPCHDQIGNGQGMIVRRGYRAPPSFHSDRLRQTEPGMFFQHITKGLGAMPDYAQQISPEDRWAIIGYVRALQLSQNARLSDLSESERQILEGKE